MAISAAADGRVVIDTHLNNQGFVKGVKSLKGQLGGLQSVVSKLGATIASVFAVRALVNFGKECVELGSNVAEVQNVVDVAFGDMSYKVEEFASTAIEQFGMSTLAAKKTASTYMAMAKGMGISEAAASDMAITLAGLSGDVASFYNISQELADTKLKSVFTGETETLKELGVVMTQTNLEAYALKQGITKSYDAMSQAEKVALRYNYVLDSLSLATGDFARTADSWANQTRVLSMLWEEFMSIMGQTLITVLTPCVKALNQIVSDLITMATHINAVVSSLFGVQQSASGVSGAISESVDDQDALTDATEETAKAQKKLLAGFDEINKLGSSTDSSTETNSTLDVPAYDTVTTPEVSAEDSAVLKFFERLKDAMQPTLDAVSRLWEKLKEMGSFSGQGLSDFYTGFLEPVGSWVLGEGLPAFLDALSAGVTFLSSAVEAAEPFLTWLWENFLQPIGEWAGDAVVYALQVITDTLYDLSDLLSENTTFSEFLGQLTPAQTALMSIATALGAISVVSGTLSGLSAITTFIESIKGLDAVGTVGKLAEVFALTAGDAGTLGESIKAVFGPGSIIAGIGAIVGGAVLAITNFISMLKDGFSWAKSALMALGIAIAAVGAIILGAPALITVVIAAIVAAVGIAVAWIVNNWEEVKEAFVSAWENIKTSCSWAWEEIKRTWSNVANWFKTNITEPITQAFENVKTSVKWIINGIIGFVEGLVNRFIGGVNKIIGALNKISFDVPEWVPVIGGKTFGFGLKEVAEVKLPRLATGSVIPPNREFLAVLGDNKTETEVVSPLSTMKRAMIEAMRESGYGGEINVTVVTQLDGREVARNQIKHLRAIERSLG